MISAYMIYDSYGINDDDFAGHGAITILEEVHYMTGFAAAWFTCDDQIISTVPQGNTLYDSKCATNGIVG
jgi:hypothetical protein